MKTLLTALFTFFSGMNPVFVSVFSVAVSAYSVFQWINSQMVLLIQKIDTLTVSSFTGTLSVSPFGLLNTFTPLSEAMSYFSAWVTLLGICATIRIVKSFVPTVAS